MAEKMATGAFVYADESGHSGANYVDPAQPIFVTAAMLVPEEGVDRICAEIEDFRRNNPASRQSTEVKFGSAVRRPQMRDAVARLLNALLANGCIPVVDVWEKRFSIATRIVDAFCDFDYNPMALTSIHPHNFERRRELAVFIYDTLPESLLNEFAASYRELSIQNLREVQVKISTTIINNGRPDVGRLIGQCNVSEMVADCTSENRHHRSLNYPSFISLIHEVDIGLEMMNRTGVLVFDEQEEFRASFTETHELFSAAASVDIESGSSVSRLGCPRILSYKMERSSCTPGLQIADALAAIVRSALCDVSGITAGSATWRFLRETFGIPNTGLTIGRYGRTARITAGTNLFQSFARALTQV